MSVNWSNLDITQPSIGFMTRIKLVPSDGEPTIKDFSASSSCREEMNYNVRNRFGHMTYRNVPKKGMQYKWQGHDRKKVAEIQLDDESLKQPFVTKLWINMPERVNVPRSASRRTRRRSMLAPISSYQHLIHVTDALVAPVCLLLNPDRYAGDWWRTSLGEARGNTTRFTWYGVDNFILCHPAVLSIVFGLFRQSVRLVRAGETGVLSDLVPRDEIRNALDQADADHAVDIVKRLKPLLGCKTTSRQYPIRAGQFNFLFDLHKAIYSKGLTEVFGPVSDAWNCRQEYGGLTNGSYTYFGPTSQNRNAKRVKELART